MQEGPFAPATSTSATAQNAQKALTDDRVAGYRLPGHTEPLCVIGREAGHRLPSRTQSVPIRAVDTLVNGLTPVPGATGLPGRRIPPNDSTIISERTETMSPHNSIYSTHTHSTKSDVEADVTLRNGSDGSSLQPTPTTTMTPTTASREPPDRSPSNIKTTASSKAGRKDQSAESIAQAATGTREFHPSEHGGREKGMV